MKNMIYFVSYLVLFFFFGGGGCLMGPGGGGGDANINLRKCVI